MQAWEPAATAVVEIRALLYSACTASAMHQTLLHVCLHPPPNPTSPPPPPASLSLPRPRLSLLPTLPGVQVTSHTATTLHAEGAVCPGAVVVNFFAPWCPWCQRLEPTWEAVTQEVHKRYPEVDGRLRFAKACPACKPCMCCSPA